jgi:trk system potassium uptake protein
VKILVLGAGRVGGGVARELVTRDMDVTVVDHDLAALKRLGDGFIGRKIHGSALDRAILLAAGIEGVDAVAVTTGRDPVNAVVALSARRRFRVPTVVARLYDPRTAEVYQRLGIRTIAPVSWGIQRIADLATATTVNPTASLGSGGVEMVEVRVPMLLDGRAVAELQVEGEIHVVAITHHGRTTLASSATRLAAGDLAHVAVGIASVGRLETLLAQR